MIQYNKKYLYSGEIVVPVFQDGVKIACVDKNNKTILLSASDLKEIKKEKKENKIVQYIKKTKEEALEYSKIGAGEVAVVDAPIELEVSPPLAATTVVETPVVEKVEVSKPVAKKSTVKKEPAKDKKTVGRVSIYDNYI